MQPYYNSGVQGNADIGDSWQEVSIKFADPKNDVAFKKIFGDENKKDILVSFLNNLLDFAGTPKEIIDISIENPFQVPRLEDLKETVLAIEAADKRNVRYIIDIQIFRTWAFGKQLREYVSKANDQQPDKAEDYPKINQVILLGFLDFIQFKDTPHYDTRHLVLEEKTNNHYFKDFELNFVELPKFEKSPEELIDVKEKWIYFVKNAGNMTMVPKELEEPKELKQAFEAANRINWTEEEWEVYDHRGMIIQDERGSIDYAYEEGIRLGVKEGIKQGAALMKKEGLVIDVIIKTTGLSREEIEELL